MSSASLPSPVRMGNYLIHLRIARGGMADVYAATRTLGTGESEIVAIKRIRREFSEDPTFLRMFLDEARITRYLKHPNIASLIDIGGESHSTYLVMEYVSGINLKTLLKRGPLPPHLAVEVGAAVGEALHAAHIQTDENGQPLNIVHRDVTPMNVMITFDGQVKLLDFGIAVARGRAEKTQAGIVKGKWSYLSPEQIVGSKVDRRADVFTLGSLIYEMVTGERAFKGSSPVVILKAIAIENPPPPNQANPDVPREFGEVISKCLQKNREDRFQTARAISEELEAISGMWNLVTEAKERENLSQYVRRRFNDRFQAMTAMIERIKEHTTVPANSVTEEHSVRVSSAPFEEKAGDLPSSDSASGAKESPQDPIDPAPSSPSHQPYLPDEEVDEEVDDEDLDWLRWPLIFAIIFGVVLGCAVAIIVWALNTAGG